MSSSFAWNYFTLFFLLLFPYLIEFFSFYQQQSTAGSRSGQWGWDDDEDDISAFDVPEIEYKVSDQIAFNWSSFRRFRTVKKVDSTQKCSVSSRFAVNFLLQDYPNATRFKLVLFWPSTRLRGFVVFLCVVLQFWVVIAVFDSILKAFCMPWKNLKLWDIFPLNSTHRVRLPQGKIEREWKVSNRTVLSVLNYLWLPPYQVSSSDKVEFVFTTNLPASLNYVPTPRN